MKKYIFVIFICFLTIITSCTQKESEVKIKEESEVKIKAGVVMKSGDIKIVARQEFMITKADLISLWEISKMEHLKDLKLIEEEIKAEMDYDNKKNRLEIEINNIKKSIASKTSPASHEVTKIVDRLVSHLNLSISLTRNYKEDRKFFEDMLKTRNLKPGKISYEETGDFIDVIEKYYIERLRTIYRGPTYENLLNNQLEEIREISKLIDNLEKETNVFQNEIFKINEEKNKLKKELQLRVNERSYFLKNKARDDFQIKIKENLVELFKTNLNGEALLTLKRGEYFLFGVIQVAQSKIIWNVPINIEKEEHYIELSNDNAFSIDDDRLVAELLDALTG